MVALSNSAKFLDRVSKTKDFSAGKLETGGRAIGRHTSLFKKFGVILGALSFIFASSNSAKALSSIPYVGCLGSDMAGDGDVTPPPGHPINIDIAPAIAAKLAFYYGQRLYVLAPRGWVCNSRQGADGSDLSVSPPAGGRDGPTISIQNWPGDPNGWKIITAYGGTYFPKLFTTKDVDLAIRNLNDPGMTRSTYLVPKYPSDWVTYVNGFVLKYRTPAEKIGIGTAITSRFPFGDRPALSALPTYGVVGLVNVPDDQFINLLVVRVPPKLAALRPVIQDFTARCQPFDSNSPCANQINFEQ